MSHDFCQQLSFANSNWNASIGSISAISFSSEVPALNLHSYKFYFARAIWFEVCQGGVRLEPKKIALTWHPHKMVSEVTYHTFTMKVEAFFVAAEVFAVDYSFESQVDADLTVTVRGTARNGISYDKFFNFRGQVKDHEGCAVIDQEIDIPDYRSKPMGPFRMYTHHLLWMIDSTDSMSISQDIVETEHPERTNLNENKYATGINRSNYWRLQKSLSVKPSRKTGGQFFVGTRWMGTAIATTQDCKDLKGRILACKNRPLTAIECGLAKGWSDLLGKIPKMKEKYRGNAGYGNLYYRAWVCILQNVSDSLVTARKTIQGPTAMVGKVCSTGFGTAQWETSLAGLLISFINPDFGVRIIESVINSLEIDGFIPEDLIFNRDVKLSSYEPLMLEYIYRRTGKTEILERNYDNAYKQLVFHIKHPAFYYLDPPRPWSLVDNYSSLLALGRIAVILGKDEGEIKRLHEWTTDVHAMLASFMDGRDLDALAYTAIYDYWSDQQTAKAMEFIRKRMITPDGLHFLYKVPDGRHEGTDEPDSFKMNGYLLFILALEKWGAEDLLDQVVEKTFTGLSANGDFWECYYVNGEPWGNGPMSIFGAFGWIWSVMDKDSLLSQTDISLF